ncbi:MAG: energy transducer TonB [Bacteroidia bacterium]|nr:energy transducer TonB [Bacteroidia bacterium]
MKNIIAILFFISLSSFLLGQNPGKKVGYMGSGFFPTKKGNAKYILFETTEGKTYKLSGYGVEGNDLAIERTYKSKKAANRYWRNYTDEKIYYPGGKLKTHRSRKGIYPKMTESKRTYYEDGTAKSILIKKNSKTVEDQAFFPDGSIRRENKWQNGKLLSFRAFFPNGKPHVSGEFSPMKDFKAKTPLIQYYPNGSPFIKSDMADMGKRKSVTQTYFGRDGNEVKVDSSLNGFPDSIASDLINQEFEMSISNAMPREDGEPYPLNIEEVRQDIGYPLVAREDGVQGSVVMRIMVDKSGVARYFYPINFVDRRLAVPVMLYILDLEFMPAVHNGEPIPFWVNIPFNFKMLK